MPKDSDNQQNRSDQPISRRAKTDSQPLAVGQLAGGIAHEFNNLLTVITGYSKILQEGMSPNHPALRKMEAISRAAAQSTELTTQLLSFGERQALEPKVIDLAGVLTGMATMLRRIAGEAIETDIRVEEGLEH